MRKRSGSARRTSADPVPITALTLLNCQFIQAHNTYAYYGRRAVASGFATLLDELYETGVRGIELDVWQQPGAWEWSIGHSGGYRAGADEQLRAYLLEISRWSLRRRSGQGHEPLVVILECKDDEVMNSFPDAFDHYVGTALSACALFTPRAVLQTTSESLLHAAQDAGRWPTLEVMRNAICLCLSGGDEKNSKYAADDHALRLAFADYPATYTPGDPAAFMGPHRLIMSVGSGPGGFLGDWDELLRRIDGQTDRLGRIWWDHIERIGLREHLADSMLAVRDGAWCVATDSAHDVCPKLGWGGFRLRPRA